MALGSEDRLGSLETGIRMLGNHLEVQGQSIHYASELPKLLVRQDFSELLPYTIPFPQLLLLRYGVQKSAF